MSTVPPAALVFLDESGANIKLTRSLARAPSGQRVVGAIPSRWGDTLSVIGAVNSTGFQAVMTMPGAVDGAVFRTYVQKVLAPTLKPGQVVVMDNLSVHKVAGVREAIEGRGAQLVYLPPYSPELNPIEKCWAQVKKFLRDTAARTLTQLEAAVSTALTLVGSEQAHAYYRCCGYSV